MRWAALIGFALLGCGFEGQGTPLPGSDEELDLASPEDLFAGAQLVDAYVAGTGGTLGPGTIEPIVWVPGRLLAEIEGASSGYNGTWDSKPARAAFVNRGLMTLSLPNQVPPGASGTSYTLWFSGQVFLDAGVQRFAVNAAIGAESFAEILDDKRVLMRCLPTMPSCAADAGTAPGWYTLRVGLRRPMTAVSHAFEVQWAAGASGGTLAAIPATRLRAPAHTEELAGWRVDLFARQRGMDPVLNGTALGSADPYTLRWAPALLGGNQAGSHYRSVGQIRVLETGSYDIAFDAGTATSMRVWLNGEWISNSTLYNATAGNAFRDFVTRDLPAGWHDVVVEGYAEGQTSGEIVLQLGKTGQATPLIPRANVRPTLGLPSMTTFNQNLNTTDLRSGMPAERQVDIVGISPSPKITAVDISFRVVPRQWTGLTATLISPAGVRAVLSFPQITMVDGQEAWLHASVPAAQLGGAVDVQGTWKLEVTHVTDPLLVSGVNVLSHVRMALRHAGIPQQVAAARFVAPTASYSKIVTLPNEAQLRSLEATTITPTGSTAEIRAQVCPDETGTACGPELTPAQLADEQPNAKHVKLTITFTSDGFATPIARALKLRYRR